jgi:GDP-mannose 6-dehydrogenase
VSLAEQLIGKGFELSVYDRNVKLASLVGANRDYILHHIPHIGRLLVDSPQALFDRSDVVVMATAEKEFGDLVASYAAGKAVIDLVGTWELAQPTAAGAMKSYDGIAW